MSRRRIRRPGFVALGTARVAVVLLILVAMIATVFATPALAYWTSTGSSPGGASTGTLSPPSNVTVPSAAAPNVTVGWTAGTGGVTPEGYFVTRFAGTVGSPACGSNPTTLVTGTSCADTAVPDGSFSYLVTAVYASWTAQSQPSGTVVVENATAAFFVVQPSDILANATMTPAVTVALRTADGGAFTTAGIPVTIAIATNPASGTLTGTTTVTTDAGGVATFADLSVTQPGVGYTLRATSTGLTAAVSNSFTVLTPPFLAAAQGFSILAGTSVTNTGASTVSGDVGVSPGLIVTGFPVGAVGGDIHINDAAAAAGQSALLTAYNDLSTRSAVDIVGELGGLTFSPGVYHSTAALQLTTTVTLDAGGDANAVFIFRTDAAFNTAASSNVILTGNAKAANVYWVVAGAAGTGASAHHLGNILAVGAITLGAGTVLIGRALSRDAVTLGASTIRFTDALPPTVAINGGAAATTKDTTPAITGTSSAAVSSPITVRVAGQTLTTSVGVGGTWSVTTAVLNAGVHEVVASVRDADGNGAAVTQRLTVEVNPAPVDLGAAASFGVLASTVLTNTGTTTVNGDLGISPGILVLGLPVVVNGSVHIADPTAAAARDSFLAAYNEVSARAPHTEIVGDLATQTFHIGIHHKTAALALTGSVTLDAEGNSDAIFIFQTGAAFDTSAGSSVILKNGAQAGNVYWVIGGAAGTGASTVMVGNMLANGAITLGASTTLAGRALSLDAVTLAGNTITRPGYVPLGIAASIVEPPAAQDLSATEVADPDSAASTGPAETEAAATTPVGSTTAVATAVPAVPPSLFVTTPQTPPDDLPGTIAATPPDTPPATTDPASATTTTPTSAPATTSTSTSVLAASEEVTGS